MLKLFVLGLQLIFIALKLAREVEWDWITVLSPMIVVATIFMVAIIIHFLRWHLDPEYRIRILLERYAQFFNDR